MATELKLFNITIDDGGFHLLTWKSKVMGRFASYKQAKAHKLQMCQYMTKDGKLQSRRKRKEQAVSGDIGEINELDRQWL